MASQALHLLFLIDFGRCSAPLSRRLIINGFIRTREECVSFLLFEHEWRTIRQKRLLSFTNGLRADRNFQAIDIIFRVARSMD